MKKIKSLLLIICLVAICAFAFQLISFPKSINKEEVKEIFLEDQGYLYGYQQLTDKEKEDYEILYYSLKMNKEVYLENVTVSQVQDLYEAVMNDHPEMYYFKGSFHYQQDQSSLYITPDIEYTQEQIEQYNKQIEDYTKEILTKANQEDNDIDKAKVIYEELIENIEYQSGENDQNILSAFLENKTVCAGYAKAYQYLLEQAGISSHYITGQSLEEDKTGSGTTGHAWVMLYINGNYYYSDPTWGDVAENGMQHTCYAYFLMSSDDMLRCYEPDGKYEETKANQYNYFEENGYYMTSYNQNMISKAVQDGLNNGTRVAEVQCANESIYKQIKNDLNNAYLGYKVLIENGCFSKNARYSCNDKLKIIELYY